MSSPTAKRVLKRPTKATTPAAPAFDIQGYVERFKSWARTKQLSESGKTLIDRMNKDDLKPLVLKHGEKDADGNYVLDFPEPILAGAYGKVDGVVAQKRAGTKTLNADRAEEFLTTVSAQARRNGEFLMADGKTKLQADEEFDLLAEAQETITLLSEDKLLALVLLGKLSESDVDKLYDQGDPTYAFTPRKVT